MNSFHSQLTLCVMFRVLQNLPASHNFVHIWESNDCTFWFSTHTWRKKNHIKMTLSYKRLTSWAGRQRWGEKKSWMQKYNTANKLTPFNSCCEIQHHFSYPLHPEQYKHASQGKEVQEQQRFNTPLCFSSTIWPVHVHSSPAHTQHWELQQFSSSDPQRKCLQYTKDLDDINTFLQALTIYFFSYITVETWQWRGAKNLLWCRRHTYLQYVHPWSYLPWGSTGLWPTWSG